MNNKGVRLTRVMTFCLICLISSTGIVFGAPNVNSSSDEEIMETLLGNNIEVDNVKITGDRRQIGTFSGASSIIGFERGVILSTGMAETAFVDGESSYNFGADGDTDLRAITGRVNHDAIVLEFDIISPTSKITFDYMFASIEWNQGADFNDAFALFVNGKNHALLPDTNDPVTIQSVLSTANTSSNTIPKSAGLFVNTEEADNFSFTGRTVPLKFEATVDPTKINHIKIVIADTGDYIYNSAVFLKGDSLIQDEPKEQKSDNKIKKNTQDSNKPIKNSNKYVSPKTSNSEPCLATLGILFSIIGIMEAYRIRKNCPKIG